MLQLKAQIDHIDKQLTIAADTIRRSLKTQADTAAQQVAALDGPGQPAEELRARRAQPGDPVQHPAARGGHDAAPLYEGLLQRYKEVGIAGGVTTHNISIVDRARAPGGPSKPQPMRTLMMAGITGLGAGRDAGVPAGNDGPGDPQATRRREQTGAARARKRSIAGEGSPAARGAVGPALAVLGGLSHHPQQPGVHHQ